MRDYDAGAGRRRGRGERLLWNSRPGSGAITSLPVAALPRQAVSAQCAHSDRVPHAFENRDGQARSHFFRSSCLLFRARAVSKHPWQMHCTPAYASDSSFHPLVRIRTTSQASHQAISEGSSVVGVSSGWTNPRSSPRNRCWQINAGYCCPWLGQSMKLSECSDVLIRSQCRVGAGSGLLVARLRMYCSVRFRPKALLVRRSYVFQIAVKSRICIPGSVVANKLCLCFSRTALLADHLKQLCHAACL